MTIIETLGPIAFSIIVIVVLVWVIVWLIRNAGNP